MSWLRAWWRTIVMRWWPQARVVEETWRTWPKHLDMTDLTDLEAEALWVELLEWPE